MSLVDTLLGRRSAENPELPLTSPRLVEWLGGMPAHAGVAVNERSALTFSAVFRAVSLLSGLVATLPLHAYTGKGPAREPVDAAVIDEPHPDLTQFEVSEHIGRSEFTHGNAFLLKVRDGALRIRELWPLQPDDMIVERDRKWATAENPAGKRFRYRDGARWITYTPFDVLHIPGLSYDGLVGLSPIQMARQGISLSLAAEQFGARMFARGGLVPGVLETESKLAQEDAERLQERWAEKTSGPDNQWKIPVLSHGAKFKAIALPPKDVQYLELRKWTVTEVARWYGVPPHLLADVERSTSWGAGIEQQNLQMLIFTVDPWLVRIEQRLSKELLPRGQYAKFTRAALLRADTQARYLAYQRAIQNTLMNADEIRALEDLPPLPDGQGQTFYRPSNLEPIGGTTPDVDDNQEDDDVDE